MAVLPKFELYLLNKIPSIEQVHFVDQRTVRSRGSPSVTATECSKCAVNDPSAETTVHWSDNTLVLSVPINTMGSNAIVIPGLNTIPVPAVPKLGTCGFSCICRPTPCPVYSRVTW